MESPAARLQHVGERLMIDASDSLRTGDYARIVSQSHGGLDISVLDRRPVFLLEAEQLCFDRSFGHAILLVSGRLAQNGRAIKHHL
jgi:hypothetical protein